MKALVEAMLKHAEERKQEYWGKDYGKESHLRLVAW